MKQPIVGAHSIFYVYWDSCGAPGSVREYSLWTEGKKYCSEWDKTKEKWPSALQSSLEIGSIYRQRSAIHLVHTVKKISISWKFLAKLTKHVTLTEHAPNVLSVSRTRKTTVYYSSLHTVCGVSPFVSLSLLKKNSKPLWIILNLGLTKKIETGPAIVSTPLGSNGLCSSPKIAFELARLYLPCLWAWWENVLHAGAPKRLDGELQHLQSSKAKAKAQNPGVTRLRVPQSAQGAQSTAMPCAPYAPCCRWPNYFLIRFDFLWLSYLYLHHMPLLFIACTCQIDDVSTLFFWIVRLSPLSRANRASVNQTTWSTLFPVWWSKKIHSNLA